MGSRRATHEGQMRRECPQCEYDLTGLPEPCVCPECGREIPIGLRSIRAWSGATGRPSVLMLFLMLLMALIMISVIMSLVRRSGVGVMTVLLGVVTLIYLIGALRIVRSSFLKLQGTTNAMLHCAPSGFGCSDRSGKITWHSWDRVDRVRCARSIRRDEWVIQIERRAYWFEPDRVLLGVFISCPRRTAALVRNTLRRHHRAWKDSLHERNDTDAPRPEGCIG